MQEEIKSQTFKINSFKEFPFDKMDKVVNAITAFLINVIDSSNGNIDFEEVTNDE